jgi:hypothetical protein
LSRQRREVSKVASIGVACLLGAAVLAWLSSPATMRLDRGGDEPVTATLEARLFGLVAHDLQRADGVETVSLVRSRAPGSSSHTPDRLVFHSTHGPVDLGRNQQLFAPDYAAIRQFLEQDGPESMTLSSIRRGRERLRFLAAQAIAFVMLLGGLGLGWRAVRSLVGQGEA